MRNILIAVSGTSPAVLTETLQALADQGVEIHEMHIVTTSVGKEEILKKLRGQGEPFAALCREYPRGGKKAAIHKELLREDHIHVVHQVTEDKEVPLADIEDETQAALLANGIGKVVRRFTSEPVGKTRVYASLAGGRKTMSFWMGCVMSLFGRPGDRLMHVLVNEPFDVCAGFYFKPSVPVDIEVTGYSASGKFTKGQKVSTADARITLGRVPFPQLRPHLKDTLWLDTGRSLDVEQLIEELNAVEVGPRLAFSDESRTVRLSEKLSMSLRSVPQYAVLRLCAEFVEQRSVLGDVGVLAMEDFLLRERAAANRLLEILDHLGSDRTLGDALQAVLAWDAEEQDVWHKCSRAEHRLAELEQALGPRNAKLRETTMENLARAKEALKAASLAVTRLKTELADARKIVAIDKAPPGSKAANRVLVVDNLLMKAEARHRRALAKASQLQGRVSEANEERKQATLIRPSLQHILQLHRATYPRLRKQANAVRSGLQQARKRLDEAIDSHFYDARLREQLKLVRDEKPFRIGLQPTLRKAERIRFGDWSRREED